MPFAASTIGDVYVPECSVPINGTGSPNVLTGSRAQTTIGDITAPYEHKVPCPKCCKTWKAPVITGSPTVFVNGLASQTIVDVALAPTGVIKVVSGNPTVLLS
tara:strand:- start:345 stop:653 length:309 start_codon:yes stop_codon:yes gene_type:complete